MLAKILNCPTEHLRTVQRHHGVMREVVDNTIQEDILTILQQERLANREFEVAKAATLVKLNNFQNIASRPDKRQVPVTKDTRTLTVIGISTDRLGSASVLL